MFVLTLQKPIRLQERPLLKYKNKSVSFSTLLIVSKNLSKVNNEKARMADMTMAVFTVGSKIIFNVIDVVLVAMLTLIRFYSKF